MKRLLVAATVGIGLIGGVGAGSASANACHGTIVSSISSTWPFAHEDREAFPPPKGALAKFAEEIAGFDNAGQLNQDIKGFCKS
jgi:hypothetical protein